MAQRRPRTSLGPPGVSGSTVNKVDGVFNEEEFKDCMLLKDPKSSRIDGMIVV